MIQAWGGLIHRIYICILPDLLHQFIPKIPNFICIQDTKCLDSMYFSICTWFAGSLKISELLDRKLDKNAALRRWSTRLRVRNPMLRARNHGLHGVHWPRSHVASHQRPCTSEISIEGAGCDSQHTCCASATSPIQKRKEICLWSSFPLDSLPI